MELEPGTVEANGIATYFERAGTDGDPLVLLHGGMTPNLGWIAQWDDFAAAHRVVAPERRGHGHTADVAGPYTYEAMAADTAAFLDVLALGPAHLVGWSDGGIVALLVARDHPELVAKVVTFGANAASAGYQPHAIETLVGLDEDSEDLAMFRAMYDPVSPDGPDHFDVVWAKIQALWTAPFDFLADLADVRAPTLVMVADDDFVTPSHAVAMYEQLPAGQLAILPGCSHGAPMEVPWLFNRIVLDFLAPDSHELLLPFRRQRPGSPSER